MNGIGRTLTGLLACLTLLGCAGCSGRSMSIQSSLPSHSSSTAPAETKSTPPGKQGDLPGTENGYLVQEPMGEEVQVDLDGDGELEAVTITTKQVEQKSGDSRWKETVLSTIRAFFGSRPASFKAGSSCEDTKLRPSGLLSTEAVSTM